MLVYHKEIKLTTYLMYLFLVLLSSKNIIHYFCDIIEINFVNIMEEVVYILFNYNFQAICQCGIIDINIC